MVDRLLVDDENPFRELVGFVDEDESDAVWHESSAFRAEMNARFADGDDGGDDGPRR